MHTAMILAAGRGERLKPLTDKWPKALCTIQGIPLIEYHVIHLAQANITNIIINHAYLGGKIRQHLGNGARFGVDITYTPEPPGGLETGGGIVNALPYLNKAPFLTVNADIFTDYPFAQLQLPAQSLAHMILVRKPTEVVHADFGLQDNGILENTNRRYTFPGIACYRPEIFRTCRPGRYSLTPLLRKWIDAGQITGELYEGIWFDIGTPKRLETARIFAANHSAHHAF